MTTSRILRRTLLAASAAAVCLPALADLADIKSAGKLRVGIDFGAPFYGYVDDKMKPIGSDVEAAELLAKDLGLQLEIVNTTNSARIPNLLSNKVDLIISSLSITPERQKAVDFSIPYGAIQAAVGAPKSLKLTGIEDLAGKTVAVTRGGPQDKIVTDYYVEYCWDPATGTPTREMISRLAICPGCGVTVVRSRGTYASAAVLRRAFGRTCARSRYAR